MVREKKKISFTEGSVFGSLIRFALPVLGALVLQAAYGAVDLLVIGLYGGSEAAGSGSGISAVGTGSSFMQMITYVVTSLAMGSTAVIGRHFGGGNDKEAGDAVGTSIVLFLIIGVALTVVLEIFAGNIATLLQAPAEAFDKTVLYIRICSGGVLVIVAYNVISSILRGFGDAKTPLIFVGVAFAVNVAGDFLLMGVFKMDVAGAAIATVTAQGVSVVASLIVLIKRKLPVPFSRKQCRIFKSQLKKILGVGLPIAIQDATVQISFLVVNSIANGMGLNPSAGYAAAQKIIMFINLVPSAVMQSSSAFVSQNIGAGKQKRARQGFFAAMVCGCGLGLALFFATFFAGSQLSYIFTRDGEVIAQGAAYLRGYAAECVLSGVLFSCCGYLTGKGKSIPVMLQGISAAVVRVALAFTFSDLDGSTLTHIALSTPLASLYGIIFFLVCFAISAYVSRRRARRAEASSVALGSGGNEELPARESGGEVGGGRETERLNDNNEINNKEEIV